MIHCREQQFIELLPDLISEATQPQLRDTQTIATAFSHDQNGIHALGRLVRIETKVPTDIRPGLLLLASLNVFCVQ